MKFTLSTVLLAAAGIGAVTAQAPASSSSTATMMSSSSSSSAAASSSTMSSAAGGSGEDSGSGGSSSQKYCTILTGDPMVQRFGCGDGVMTTVPPYDSMSLESFLIAGYTPGAGMGYHYSEVASQLADSVTKYYPTLTVSYSDIVSAYAESIEAKASPNSAVSVPNSLGSVAAVAVAIVAGGAFLL